MRTEVQGGRKEGRAGSAGRVGPGGPREEASTRQANLLNGKHEKLYRKAGFMN